MNKVIAELTKLEDAIRSAKKGVLTSKIQVDQSKILEMINKIKVNLPHVINEANSIVSEKQGILRKAEEYKEETERYCLKQVQKAQDEANRLVAESRITKESKIEAANRMKEAEDFCNQIKEATVKNIDSLLDKSEKDLAKVINSIRASREELNGGLV